MKIQTQLITKEKKNFRTQFYMIHLQKIKITRASDAKRLFER